MLVLVAALLLAVTQTALGANPKRPHTPSHPPTAQQNLARATTLIAKIPRSQFAASRRVALLGKATQAAILAGGSRTCAALSATNDVLKTLSARTTWQGGRVPQKLIHNPAGLVQQAYAILVHRAGQSCNVPPQPPPPPPKYVDPPTVQIIEPASSSTFTQGTVVTYSAAATDPTDGTLSGSAVRWYEDATQIGSGSLLSHAESVLGTHLITVVATDGGGKTASASISITVAALVPPPPPPPNPNAPKVEISAYGNGTSFGVCANTSDQNANEYFYLPIEGQVGDPHGLPISYTWTQSLNGGASQVVATDGPPQTFKVFHLPSDGVNPTTNVISLTASDGTYSTIVALTGKVYPQSFCVPTH